MTKILSIDGGGIRGLVPLCVLYSIEKRTGQAIYKQFDIITGTSTGAIIAIGLSLGISIENLLQFYLGAEAKKIFSKSLFRNMGFHCPQYDYKNIQEVLQQTFGNKTFADCLTGLVVPADDWSNRRGRIFSSFEERNQNLELWQVARASSAAETYFKAYNDGEGCYFDGGMYANNPTDLAIVESVKYKNSKLNDLFVVSLGTGTMVDKIKAKDVENMWYYGIISNIIGETMDRITSKTHDVLSRLISSDRYFRLQFDCPDEYSAMDNANSNNLNGLRDLAGSYITADWKDDINSIVEYLKTASMSTFQA